MIARTPLKKNAKPFTPIMGKWAPCQDSSKANSGATFVAMMPVFFASDAMANSVSGSDSPKCGAVDEKKVRGRAATREVPSRLPSRTPSPSGQSVCLSEASTAETWLKQEGSLASTADLSECIDDLRENDDLPVKNTFVHFTKSDVDALSESSFEEEPKKLSRSSSTPSIMLTCAFTVRRELSMEEKHELGECNPCAYFYAKADGCRLGSECKFCHLCPATEVKTRKKQRRKMGKAAKKALMESQLGDSDQPMLQDDLE